MAGLRAQFGNVSAARQQTLHQLMLAFHHPLERLMCQLLAFQESLVRRGSLLLQRLHRPQTFLHGFKNVGETRIMRSRRNRRRRPLLIR